MTVNLKKALSLAGDKVTVLYGDKADNAAQIATQYRSLNPSVKTLAINNTKFLPHMEHPEAFLEVFQASRRL